VYCGDEEEDEVGGGPAKDAMVDDMNRRRFRDADNKTMNVDRKWAGEHFIICPQNCRWPDGCQPPLIHHLSADGDHRHLLCRLRQRGRRGRQSQGMYGLYARQVLQR